MINFDGNQLSTEFLEVFGKPVAEISVRQMWWLVKFGKHIRGRCRSNAALNNFLRRNFPHLQFREVDKTAPDGRHYQGLVINDVDGEDNAAD